MQKTVFKLYSRRKLLYLENVAQNRLRSSVCHTVTVFILFKKVFYGTIRRTSEITYYFLLVRFAFHLVFRGNMNHMKM